MICLLTSTGSCKNLSTNGVAGRISLGPITEGFSRNIPLHQSLFLDSSGFNANVAGVIALADPMVNSAAIKQYFRLIYPLSPPKTTK
ncbi:MAG: hypothetical protein LBO02_02225 [Holosporaceae bacterium]|nr:hypothetical protein [Holosporaceae bacterium]